MGLKWPNPNNKGLKWASHALNLAFFGSLAAGVVIAESQPGQHVRVGSFNDADSASRHAETWNRRAVGTDFVVKTVGAYYTVDSTQRYENPNDACKAMTALANVKGAGQCTAAPK